MCSVIIVNIEVAIILKISFNIYLIGTVQCTIDTSCNQSRASYIESASLNSHFKKVFGIFDDYYCKERFCGNDIKKLAGRTE